MRSGEYGLGACDMHNLWTIPVPHFGARYLYDYVTIGTTAWDNPLVQNYQFPPLSLTRRDGRYPLA